MGVERLIVLLEERDIPLELPTLDAYLVLVGDTPQRQGVLLADRLRREVPGLRLMTHCGGGSFKTQFKKADRSGARFALVLGEDELAQGVIGVKYLREEREQEQVALDDLASYLRDRI
jgi:histidyl-tRNA synthetase